MRNHVVLKALFAKANKAVILVGAGTIAASNSAQAAIAIIRYELVYSVDASTVLVIWLTHWISRRFPIHGTRNCYQPPPPASTASAYSNWLL